MLLGNSTLRLALTAFLAAVLAVLAVYWFINPQNDPVTCTRGSVAGLITGCDPAPRLLTFEDVVPTSAPATVTMPPQPSPTPEPVISALPATASKAR